MVINFRQLYEARKRVIRPTKWVQSDARWFALNVSLEIDGVVIEGLQLRGGAPQTIPDRAVGFHLQHHPANSACVGLGRAEWRPLSPHTNPKTGPMELQFLRIVTSHIHSFELNWMPELGRMRAGNLPIARPMNPEPENFEIFLQQVGKEFNIRDIETIEHPPWRVADLFGV